VPERKKVNGGNHDGERSTSASSAGVDAVKGSQAILGVLAQTTDGLSNAEIAHLLDIRSDYQGLQKDYLSWSVLGLLLNERRIVRRGRRYFLPEHEEKCSVNGDASAVSIK